MRFASIDLSSVRRVRAWHMGHFCRDLVIANVPREDYLEAVENKRKELGLGLNGQVLAWGERLRTRAQHARDLFGRLRSKHARPVAGKVKRQFKRAKSNEAAAVRH